LAEKLIKQYDLELIKSSRYDYLGDLYLENVISKTEVARKGLMLTPQPIVDLMCQMTLGKTDGKINILDPYVGTGRFLLTANTYAPNAGLFGVDNNITMIRTAFTNAAIHIVTMYLLNADSLTPILCISTLYMQGHKVNLPLPQ
jgi:type I restriction-modification system DNA methylase subunit